jgi:transcriptional antiterminator NusG
MQDLSYSKKHIYLSNSEMADAKKVAKKAPKAKKEITAEVAEEVAVVTKPENPDLKWFVVNTHSGHEKKVAKLIEQRIDASDLEEKVTEVLVPTRNVVTVKDGHQKIKEEQIYPGYVLVKMIMDEQTWYIVRNTEGVTGFVGTEGKPKPVDPKEVEAIKKLMSIEQPEFKASFRMGDAVKIKDGAFADFMGTVNAINEQRGQVTVLISIFGRETPVDLDFSDVIKL